MRIIAKQTLERFGKRHAPALQPLRAWHELVKKETWASPEDIKRTFPSVTFVGGGRLVFNIKGNVYRLVARVRYKKPMVKQGVIHVIKVMTHAEYDKMDVTTLRNEGQAHPHEEGAQGSVVAHPGAF
ncbi:MAG: type II toxin-antitoxin system HigB family toxin [Flavobacteriales bacterium]|jgi:mRNA interferase HigB|nr:type II toxin-antitoxin system HigB family toxin [Flavobacteriales bacterium]